MNEFETAEVRRLVEHRLEAIRARDVERSTSMVAADYLLFDVVDPLQSKSAVAASKRAKEWFATFRGPIGYEIHDLQIVAADGVGFSHGLNHVSATESTALHWTCGGEGPSVTKRSREAGGSPTSTTLFRSMSPMEKPL